MPLILRGEVVERCATRRAQHGLVEVEERIGVQRHALGDGLRCGFRRDAATTTGRGAGSTTWRSAPERRSDRTRSWTPGRDRYRCASRGPKPLFATVCALVGEVSRCPPGSICAVAAHDAATAPSARAHETTRLDCFLLNAGFMIILDSQVVPLSAVEPDSGTAGNDGEVLTVRPDGSEGDQSLVRSCPGTCVCSVR